VTRRPTAPGLVTAIAVLLVAARPVSAQDTVIVIDPNAPPIQTLPQREPPPEVVEEAVARHNDSATTRFHGSFTLAGGSVLRGDVALYRGTLRVYGRLTGRITVVNGNLVIAELGTVEGDVLVVGGRVQIAPGGLRTGLLRVYSDPAPVIRTAVDLLEVRAPRAAGEVAGARKSFQAGRINTTLALETGGTYNRVEGLPIHVGPSFTVQTGEAGEFRLDARAIFRTENDQTDQLPPYAFLVRLEWEGRAGWRPGAGLRWHSTVEPIEEQPLSRAEVGWSTLLFGRDYRDYLEVLGVEASTWLHPFRPLRLGASLRVEDQQTVPASDPFTLFRQPDPWRANPLIDDGTYTSVRLDARYDSRNNQPTPTRGWLASAWIEHTAGDDVAPITLPSEVREPLPTQSYGFARVGFDLRKYLRVNQSLRANLRVLGGGWIGGDPLPVQRRVSLGGSDLLPGHPFRHQRCAPASYTDPSLAALCDRFLAVQTEVRFRFPLALRDLYGSRELLILDRLFGGEQADLVVLGDMGKAWLTGDGPGKVPNNRVPVLREWEYDVGLGLDLDGLAVYVAKSLSTGESPRITFRLQRRF
jgi:hypothetical protein